MLCTQMIKTTAGPAPARGCCTNRLPQNNNRYHGAPPGMHAHHRTSTKEALFHKLSAALGPREDSCVPAQAGQEAQRAN
jgi:hypothetical protein